MTFDAFLPPLVRERLAANPAADAAPALEVFSGALLLTDLTGFSTIAEQLAVRGRRGAEDLKDLLNQFFGGLVQVVHEHEGQLVCFPGDAAIALWSGDQAVVAHTASACAMSIHDHLRRLEPVDRAHPLRPRSAIAVGEIRAMHVGDRDRSHLVVIGDALTQVIAAIAGAAPGEVMVSPRTWEKIAARAQGRAGSAGVRVDSVAAFAPRQPRVHGVASLSPALLRPFVPRPAQILIESGHSNWLAEFRRATVLFVNIGGFDIATHDSLVRFQEITIAIHAAVAHYGGSVNQMLADDKGTVLVCGWGIVMHAHADDARRAARAALRIVRELETIGVVASCGIASGDVFTGLRGTPERCEYAMIGKVVNLASQLMQVSAGAVLCDSASMEGAGSGVTFEPLAQVLLKAGPEPVQVYRARDQGVRARREMFGRISEREQLRQRIDALVERRLPSLVVIEGEAGIGKSRLLGDAIQYAGGRQVRAITATGDAIERSTPYYAWRTPLRTLFGLDGGAAIERSIRARIDNEPRLRLFAALLNPVLGVNFEESEESAAVTAHGRSLLTRDLLVHLCRNVIADEPVLFVLDDTQWFDSASWVLAEALHNAGLEAIVLVALRPVPDGESSPELRQLRDAPGTLVLRLERLTGAESEELACRRLGARALDAGVASVIHEKAEGHPYFVEELTSTLRMRHLVVVERGLCRFASSKAAAESSLLPDTVQVVVSSRIDQLTVPQQLTVKVASVFGQSFTLRAIHASYPVSIDEQTLITHFDSLVSHDLFRVVGEAGDSGPSLKPDIATPHQERTFSFKHAITRQVAYELLPYAQRRQLHAAVARWYERAGPAETDRLSPLLAHHWSEAQDLERALRYLERAGEQALTKFANLEAVRFYGDALATLDQIVVAGLSGRRPDTARVYKRLRLRRRLGDAHANLGQWAEAREHLQRALEDVQQPLPESRVQWMKAFATELLNQLTHRLRPATASSTPQEIDWLREQVCTLERLGGVSYFTERLNVASYCVLAALNRAERLGPSSELALVYADAGNVVGIMGLHRLALIYNRLARRTARRLPRPASTKARCRCAVYRIGAADWDACADLDRSMAVSDQFGDPTQWGEAAAIRTRAAHFRGEYQLGLTIAREMRQRSASTGAEAHTIWGLDGEAWSLFYLGDHAAAIECAVAGLAKLAPGRRVDRVPTLDFTGVLALARLHCGERDASRAAALQILEILRRWPRPGHLAALGLSAAAEALTAQWEQDVDQPSREESARQAHKACAVLSRYSRINPCATARALLWEGCRQWLRRSRVTAHRRWRGALARAVEDGLPYEAARAYYEIARHLPQGDPARAAHLTRAEAGFAAIGAHFDLQRAKTTSR